MAVRSAARADSRLDIWRGICHAFASAADLEEVTASAGRWVRAVAGPKATIRIALPDRAGRLRVAAGQRYGSELGRMRSAKRRMAFRTGTPALLDVPRSSDRSLAILPLVCRGESVGVLEVVGPRRAIGESWETLEDVASQAAIAVRNISQEERLRQEVETLGGVVRLGRELVRAHSPEAAVRAAVRFHHERFQVPIAAWVAKGDPTRMFLASVRGIGPRKRKALRTTMSSVPRWESIPPDQQGQLAGRVAEILGVERLEVVGAGDALLLAGEAAVAQGASLDIVGSLLEDVLHHLATVARAEQRNEQLDLGLAWTAHELRGPLLGVNAALEFLLRSDTGSDPARAMLRRSQHEVEQLAGLAEGLLRWAAGGGPLNRREADLVTVVHEAVESCRLETGQDRVRILGTERAIVRIDPVHVRGAVANIVRNAVTYSPPDTEVVVRVEAGEGSVTVSVNDEGPGIPPTERESIFQPFVRGGGSGHDRTGNGLGLFIARRVVEAHGGRISLGSRGKGATFRIELPLGQTPP